MENNEEFRLDFLVPGTELREGLEIIAERKMGALIVVGNATKLEKNNIPFHNKFSPPQAN